MSVQTAEKSEVREGKESPQLTVSAKFDLLSNDRRRCLLRYLQDETECSIRDLSRHVAAWENDVGHERVTWKQRKRVYTGLHQTHLPRLDEFGVIEYDCDRGTVRATNRLELFEPYLDPEHRSSTVSDEGDVERAFPWDLYYAGIGLVAIVLTIGTLAQVPVLGAIPPVVIAAFVVGALLATMAIQTIQSASDRGWSGISG